VLKPEKGLVIRYDFLFENQREQGRYHGKDRPCAVVLTSRIQNDGKWTVVVCPITHTPPDKVADGVEIPAKVRDHLGLDEGRSWIKVNELNRFPWEDGRIPFGLTPIARGRWEYGYLPRALYRQMRSGVEHHVHLHSVAIVDRDDSTGPKD
jgi:mRNA-degrading endonuclease toxin of MazEF toxin-antitoxin module